MLLKPILKTKTKTKPPYSYKEIDVSHYTADKTHVEEVPQATHIKVEGKLVIRPHFISKAFMKIKTIEAFLVIGADVKEKLKVKKKKIKEHPNSQLNF